MLFEKVTKEHIIQGIKDFEEKGIPNGFGHSSTYDFVYKGKAYPPKSIMAYANFHAEGRTIEPYFKGGLGTDCFKAFERNGFVIEKKSNTMNEELYILKQDFLEKWPLEKLEAMTLEEYTDTNRENSFCYWLEHRTRDLGSIVGGSSYKFGIYKMGATSKTESATNRTNDGFYAWHTKYGESALEAFNTIKSLIISIAEYAKVDNLNPIEDIDLGDAYKWKIAFMYSDYKVINIFKSDALKFIANSLYPSNNNIPAKYGDLNHYILSKNTEESYFVFTKKLWKHYDNYNSKEKEFKKWLEGYVEKGSNKTSSYLRAIKILINEFKIAVYTENDINVLQDLYEDLIINQRDPNGKYAYHKKSYGEKGFYSAAIKTYIQFLNNEPKSIVKEEDEKYTTVKNEISQPLNQILYGPPGTGKTYNTINKSIAIANPEFEVKQDRSIVKKEYDRLVDEGQIVFTTFHQSMAYEDFVEGIKPETKKGIVSYDVQDGVFKKLCDKAQTFSTENSVSVSKKVNIEKRLQKLKEELEQSEESEIEISMTKTSYHITDITNKHIKFRKASGGTGHDLVINSLKKIALGEKEMIGGLRAYYDYLISYLNAYKIEAKEVVENKPFVLIIDEINRGNVSAIFGELITLLEVNKRIGNKEALTVTLPYSKETFGVPNNLYVIGTMNTADRSVEALDTALRRRFEFKEMMPNYQVISKVLKDKKSWNDIQVSQILEKINKRIIQLIDRDHQIGHSYFLKLSKAENITNELKNVFSKNIIPLLKEYFFNDANKLGLVLGDGFMIEETHENIFAEFKKGESSDYENDTFEVKDPIEMTDEEFVIAIQKLIN